MHLQQSIYLQTKLKINEKIKFIFLAVVTLAMGFSSCSDDDDKEVTKSSKKEITQFKVGDTEGSISEADKTITLGFSFGIDVTKLSPTVTISDKATVSPTSGTEVNLTQPVEYTVTAEDGTTAKYTVTATVAKNSEAKIVSFDIGEGEAKIVGIVDETQKTAALVVPFGADVTKLTPTIGIAASSVDPKSGVEKDFTQPVEYAATADDGTTVKYTVTVTVGEFATAITTVDKTTVVVGQDIVLTGSFAKTGNVVELVAGETTLKLAIKAESETAITATVDKAVVQYGDYTLNVTSNGTKASYATKIVVADIPAPIIDAYNAKSFLVGDVVKITGKNLADVKSVRVFSYNAGEQAWVILGDEITPDAATATTVDFKIPAQAAGSDIKVILLAPNRASKLPEAEGILKVLDPTAPLITALDGEKFMERRWVTITGKNLAPESGNSVIVYFKLPGASKEYVGAYGNVNAGGTEVTVLLPSNAVKGKQSLFIKVDEKNTNEFELEIIENTLPVPVVTSYSKLDPIEDEMITLTGSNFTDIDDTRIQLYQLIDGGWKKFDFVLKPRAVTTTSVSFVLNYIHIGIPTKVVVIANGRESVMPADNNIITVKADVGR